MSILKRTGTGVSDVAYQDGIKAGDKVFTKDQKWTTGSAGGTYNCVHRTGSGIADIAYQSETIGKALSTYAVGSIVKIKENNVLKNFIVLSHGYPASGRTLLLRKDIHSERQWHTVHNGGDSCYVGSAIDTWLNSTYLNSIVQAVRSKITAVTIKCVSKGSSSGVTMLSPSRSVFLLSSQEIAGYTNQKNMAEGSQIPYFDEPAIADRNAKCIAYYNGTASKWWLRSMRTTGRPEYINSSGAIYGGSGAYECTESYGIRPAITLPSNIAVNPSTNEVIG